jgi:shikimate kinase
MRQTNSRPAIALCVLFLAAPWAAAAKTCNAPSVVKEATPEEIRAFFQARKKTVLTFAGYSGAEYEDKAAMLKQAARILDQSDPKTTIVNGGATAVGIGAVYKIAKQKGFLTTGIVSSQARDSQAELSPCADFVFFVRDETWGGFLPDTETLSPTSKAMVENSDRIVAIGGGEVARDELMAARKSGKKVEFIPADMNHRIAREKALKKGQPAPTDFRGAAASVFYKEEPRE